MVARFLVTTADERTWRTDRPLLFLGEWCRLYERRSIWQGLDAEVVPYHWDDRSQLLRDYRYLQGFYESLLREVGDALNVLHGTQHTLRYWRILAGPWLGHLTQVIFDRWTMIQRAVQDYELSGTLILDIPPDDIVPRDTADLFRKYEGDSWNHAVYGTILRRWTSVPCETAPPAALNTGVAEERRVLPPTWHGRLLRLGARFAAAPLALTDGWSSSLIIGSGLRRIEELQLQVALGQIPRLWFSPQPPVSRLDHRLRMDFRLGEGGNTQFERCIRQIIPQQIPVLFLEGYRELCELASSLPWPKSPRVIYTTINHYADDVFKTWAAGKVERGAPLVIGQHGGHYGTGLWSFGEDHDQAIADRYVTWGWTDGGATQYPLGTLNVSARKDGNWDPYGGLLLVTTVQPRYSYWMYSIAVAGQTEAYLNDQLTFASALSSALRRQLLVRLYALDRGWCQAARWKDAFPDVQLDDGTGSIEPLIRRCRLYIATYNATTFLETMARNIPTIMFWNPRYWELRPSAQPYFDRLKQVGIFHQSPEAAAAKAGEVWDDVKAWWNEAEIQEARAYFCNRYARIPARPIQMLKRALTSLDTPQ